MTDRTEELKTLIMDDECFDRSEERAELKGRQEMRDEIREFAEMFLFFEPDIQNNFLKVFDAKFGSDKK